ncbi:aldo/keto reductase [Micromonospora mirobrigensis]|uniref:Aldo/keto reductase family protein n=1 Tax=Micromonospora mirobrigensis TaxID=262898 RepID=A0A1C4WA41_9ACTN|nr:aldo/keto reductase [Micromonospora mirobrigensis]SCE93042.1 Aldo/keto reductase family protein [Micromonospora mirobrigensis]
MTPTLTGEAIRLPGIARDEIFVETRVWVTDHGYDATLHAFDRSARKLGVEQIDLLIPHQAVPTVFDRTIASCRAPENLLAETDVVPAVNQTHPSPHLPGDPPGVAAP